jgi:Arc/MetJ-type ribon-helix-helix transcriptional regulator
VAEVVRAGVALLRRAEADELRRAWQDGLDSGDAGPLDWAELRAAARKELAALRT